MAWDTVLKLCIALMMTSLFASIAHAYPEGPPLSACRDMQPRTQMGELEMEGHTERAQSDYPTMGRSTTPPYHILIHPMPIQYQPNGQYNVYVLADQTTGINAFLGILMQARKITCYGNDTIGVEDDALGSFTLPTWDVTLLETMDCNEDTASAVSHKSRQLKINETATWHAPDTYVGHIAFYATIVQEDIVYWMGAHSLVLLDPNEPPPLACEGCTSAQTSLKTVVVLFIAHKLMYMFNNR